MLNFFIAFNRTAFQLGNINIQWYAILIASGAFLGYLLFTSEAKRFGINEDDRLDLVFWGMMFGFIGARLYYVIFKLDNYLQNPLEILNIRGGGMAIYGGVIGGALTIWFLARRRNLSLLNIYDAAAPGLLLAQAVGRWGNFVNQEAHGDKVTRAFLEKLMLPDWLIEQMNIEGDYYHPTFLYESLWNIVGVLLMMIIRRKVPTLKQGDIMATYFIWYGMGRAWIEGMRTDSLYIGSLRVSQWLSLLLILAGLGWLIYSHWISSHKIPYYREGLIIENYKEGLI